MKLLLRAPSREPVIRATRRRTDYRLARVLIAIESAVVVILLVALLVLSAIQVVGRYVLNAPVSWTEELSQLSIVWLGFIGAGLVSAKSDHVTMRIGGRRLGRRGRIFLAFTAYVVIIASCMATLVLGVGPMVDNMSLALPATHWPSGLTYIGVLAGIGLIAIHSAINALVIVRGGYDEAQEDLEEMLL